MSPLVEVEFGALDLALGPSPNFYFFQCVVRSVRYSSNPRHNLRSPGQHHQRKDLRLHVVLAHHSQLHHCTQPGKVNSYITVLSLVRLTVVSLHSV